MDNIQADKLLNYFTLEKYPTPGDSNVRSPCSRATHSTTQLKCQTSGLNQMYAAF